MNRLAREGSLYLRQHADDPVDWYPWGDEALQRARVEGRPIFLSIGYASCHWCHVMAREVFRDPEVARVLNERWISVKVDREERPDLDAAYMEALQILTGSGGWPMSLFLTGDLHPFHAATYLPKTAFLATATRLADALRDRPAEVRRVAGQVAALVAEAPAPLASGPFTIADAAALVRALAPRVDPEWGGLAGPMKFPDVPRWRAVLHVAARTADDRALGWVRLSLDRMASGGLFDHLGHGFHRYTVDRGWSVPHFEKMLYDQALLALLYLEAAEVLSEPAYAEVARATLRFVTAEMQEPEGAFAASFDADSDGREGTFYTWTADELVQAVGPDDGRALAHLLGVTAPGPVDGRSVLTRRTDPAALAPRLGRDPADLEALFARHRPALLAARARRSPPARDAKIVTAWNGLAIQALARGGAALDEPDLLRAAARAAEHVLRANRWPDGRLAAASNAGTPSGPGGLDEHAALATGLFELHLVTGEARWLEAALALVDAVLQGFSREEGGFWSTSHDLPGPLGRRFEVFDLAVPCGNGLLALLLPRLAARVGRPDHAARAVRYLAAEAASMRASGLAMGASILAAVQLEAPACGPDGCTVA